MFLFTAILKKGYEGGYESSYLRTEKFDILLIGMSLMYLFYSFGSFFVQLEDHGSFFEHIRLITVLYLTITIPSLFSKSVFYHRVFAAVSFSAMAVFFSFSTFGMFISMSIAILIAFLGIIRPLETNFVTGTMIGYWMVLLFTSSQQYDLFGAMEKGFMATLVELWTIFFNAGDFAVFDQALGGFRVTLAIFFGYLFVKIFNRKEGETPKQIINRSNLKKEKIDQQNEKHFPKIMQKQVVDNHKLRKKPIIEIQEQNKNKIPSQKLETNDIKIDEVEIVDERLRKVEEETADHTENEKSVEEESNYVKPEHDIEKNGELRCSFCGHYQSQVKKLIAGPGVYICDECTELSMEIIEEELRKEGRDTPDHDHTHEETGQQIPKLGELRCSFCGHYQSQVKRLITGPEVYICDECIELCGEIIEEGLGKDSVDPAENQHTADKETRYSDAKKEGTIPENIDIFIKALGHDPRQLDKEEIEKCIVDAQKKWLKRINAPRLERRQEAERMLVVIEEVQKTFL